MRLIISIFIQGLLVYGIAAVLQGVLVADFTSAILVAIVLGVVNSLVKPLLTILTLPITILTLGLFLFIINGAMVLLVDYLLPGFAVDGLLRAIIFSLVFSIFNYLFIQHYRD